MFKNGLRILCSLLVIILIMNPITIGECYELEEDLGISLTGDVRGVTADGYIRFVYYAGNKQLTAQIPANNGTEYTLRNNPVAVYDVLGELPSDAISYYHSYYDNISTSSDRLHASTAYFNCHSYAWFSQDTSTNRVWMNNPSKYYEDGSYYEVSAPAVGDIICYFDDKGTPTNYSDDKNLHSGIVVQVYNVSLSNGIAGSYAVESKWAQAGLYRHNGYECPYTDFALTYNSQIPEDNRAEYVKFYRMSGHTHNFNTYNDFGNDDYHQSICNCGMIINNPHNWVLHYGKSLEQRGVNYIPEYYCVQCGAFSLNP